MKITDQQNIIDTQLAQIFSLRQEIEKLKTENENLKKKPTSNLSSETSDEEFIALNELKKLKIKSQNEELTYEDAKRVELYFKVVKAIRNPKDEEENPSVKKQSTEELLAQLTLVK